MKDRTLSNRVMDYLANHPQHLSTEQACALAGRKPRTLDLLEPLTKAGFGAVKSRDGYVLTDTLVSPDWRTGGVTGGSCWGGEANQPVSSDEKPAWLEQLLEEIVPEITFLKFRRLQEKLADHGFTRGEYYGNYSEYAFQTLKVADLLAVLDA